MHCEHTDSLIRQWLALTGICNLKLTEYNTSTVDGVLNVTRDILIAHELCSSKTWSRRQELILTLDSQCFMQRTFCIEPMMIGPMTISEVHFQELLISFQLLVPGRICVSA